MISKNKADWGPGPWQDEPDRKHWVDKATGLNCLILRGPISTLCGYVGIPRGHPASGMCSNPIEEFGIDENIEWWRRHVTQRVEYKIKDIRVHGGLTFAGHWEEVDPDLWWFGFDCAHAWDLIPSIREDYHSFESAEYRDFAYVIKEVESLAKQLAAIKKEDHEQGSTSQEVEPGQPGAGEQ